MRSASRQPVDEDDASAGAGDMIQLCDYVDRAFEEIVERFEDPSAQALFERTLEQVTGLPAEVRRIQSAVVSRHVARFPMAWRAGRFEGRATLTTIVLHGGREPITELLVRVDAPGAAEVSGLGEDGTIRLLRNFLDVLTRELAVVIDVTPSATEPVATGDATPEVDRA